MFKNARTFPLEISKETTYTGLVDKVYNRVDIDRSKYDLKLEVPYEAGNMPIEPALLKDDIDVKYYTKCKSRRKYALCVTLISKEITAFSANKVDKGKNVINEELPRVELNKRRKNLIITDRDDEVYVHDRDNYHNNEEEDDEEQNNKVDEDKSDKGEDGHNSDKETEFEEFVNHEEYKDFVKHFAVPSGHGEPSKQGEPSRDPRKDVSQTDFVRYSWEAPDFTAADVVKEERNEGPTLLSHSSTGNKNNDIYLYMENVMLYIL